MYSECMVKQSTINKIVATLASFAHLTDAEIVAQLSRYDILATEVLDEVYNSKKLDDRMQRNVKEVIDARQTIQI